MKLNIQEVKIGGFLYHKDKGYIIVTGMKPHCGDYMIFYKDLSYNEGWVYLKNCKKRLELMHYRIEDYHGKYIENINEYVQKMFKDLGLRFDKLIACTCRWEYDPSDLVSWVLNYDDRDIMNEDKKILMSLKYGDEESGKPLFNVSGNGYGTGLSIMLPLGEIYDK